MRRSAVQRGRAAPRTALVPHAPGRLYEPAGRRSDSSPTGERWARYSPVRFPSSRTARGARLEVVSDNAIAAAAGHCPRLRIDAAGSRTPDVASEAELRGFSDTRRCRRRPSSPPRAAMELAQPVLAVRLASDRPVVARAPSLARPPGEPNGTRPLRDLAILVGVPPPAASRRCRCPDRPTVVAGERSASPRAGEGPVLAAASSARVFFALFCFFFRGSAALRSSDRFGGHRRPPGAGVTSCSAARVPRGERAPQRFAQPGGPRTDARVTGRTVITVCQRRTRRSSEESAPAGVRFRAQFAVAAASKRAVTVDLDLAGERSFSSAILVGSRWSVVIRATVSHSDLALADVDPSSATPWTAGCDTGHAAPRPSDRPRSSILRLKALGEFSAGPGRAPLIASGRREQVPYTSCRARRQVVRADFFFFFFFRVGDPARTFAEAGARCCRRRSPGRGPSILVGGSAPCRCRASARGRASFSRRARARPPSSRRGNDASTHATTVLRVSWCGS